MGQSYSRPTSISSTSKTTNSSSGRLYYIDNFRTYLTALVILHHVSISYGGLGTWPYMSDIHRHASSPTLVGFNILNQSYFMGSFFFLSGMMSASTLRRKGRYDFMATKLVKLGIPTLVYSLVGPPVVQSLMRSFRGQSVGLELYASHWNSLRGARGPVWFTATLLAFDAIYSSLLANSIIKLPKLTFVPTMLLEILATFLIRIPYPLGRLYIPLGLQLGYLPQYAASYIFGTISAPPTKSMLTKSQRICLLAASFVSGASILGLLYYCPEAYKGDSFAYANGGWNLLSFSMVVCNETIGSLLASSILDVFRKSRWGRNKWGAVAKYTYAIFLTHPIACVACQMAFDTWETSAVVKAIVVGGTSLMTSVGFGWTLSSVPGVSRVVL